MAKAWERREKESEKAYEAFLDYLTQPAAHRSIASASQSLAKSIPLLKTWSAKHEWVERVRAFDNESERKALGMIQNKAAERIAAMRARHRKVGRKAIELVAEMLERPDIAETMTLADAYRLMRGGLLLERSGFETSTAQSSVATSGDLTDPLKQGSMTPQAGQPQATTMLRKLEIEVIGAGGQLVPASDIAAAMAALYDKPGER